MDERKEFMPLEVKIPDRNSGRLPERHGETDVRKRHRSFLTGQFSPKDSAARRPQADLRDFRRKLRCCFRTSVSPCLSGNLPLWRLGMLIWIPAKRGPSNEVKACRLRIMLALLFQRRFFQTDNFLLSIMVSLVCLSVIIITQSVAVMQANRTRFWRFVCIGGL